MDDADRQRRTDNVLFGEVVRLAGVIEEHRAGMAKAASQRAEIVHELNQRYGYRTLAARLGVSTSRVQQIVTYAIKNGGIKNAPK